MSETLRNGFHAQTRAAAFRPSDSWLRQTTLGLRAVLRHRGRESLRMSASRHFAPFALSCLRVLNLCRTIPVVAAAWLLLAGVAQAAVIVVNTVADVAVGDLPGECSLRAAVAAANDAVGYDGCASGSAAADQVVFDPALSGKIIVLSEGELLVTGTLNITGPAPGDSGGITIDGNRNSRIFNVLGSQNAPFDFGLAGVTLTGGRTTDENEPGGAVNVLHAHLNLENVLIIGNSTEGPNSFGGGVAVHVGDASINSSRIAENSTGYYGASGGGLFMSGGKLELVHSVVSHNTAMGFRGGGMHISDADTTITNSEIFGNSLDSTHARGGGVSFIGGGFLLSDSTLEIVDSSVSGNSVEGESSQGGGIYSHCGEIVLLGSTISGNSVAGMHSRGGGAYIEGGGIWDSCLDATVTVTNSTVSGNSATGEQAFGGGLSIFGVSTTLTHVTVANNRATQWVDGLLHSRSFHGRRIDIHNSLIVQAGADEIACRLDEEFFDITSVLATDDSCQGDVASATSIVLRPLATNGGNTRTHALGEHSVAIDAAGDCFEDFGIDQDQRGISRPGLETSACDIGAYEFQNETIFRDGFEQESA